MQWLLSSFKEKIVKDGQNQNKYCRFHFCNINPETKKTTGKEIHPFKAIVTEGKHSRYEGPRDHPRLIMHVKSRLFSWIANCDTQPIVDQDLLAFFCTALPMPLYAVNSLSIFTIATYYFYLWKSP